MRSLAHGRNFEIGMTQQTSRPMQHHGRNFVTAAFGRHRSMHDRGERGTVPNKLHGESRAWVHDSATPSPGPVSARERSATQSTLPACQASAGPATSGQGRQLRSGGARRDRLYRMAPVWPHGDKQVTTLGTLTAPTPVSCRNSIRCHQRRA